MSGSAGRGESDKCHYPNLRGDRNAGGAIAHFLFVDSLTGPPPRHPPLQPPSYPCPHLCPCVCEREGWWRVRVRVRVVMWCGVGCVAWLLLRGRALTRRVFRCRRKPGVQHPGGLRAAHTCCDATDCHAKEQQVRWHRLHRRLMTTAKSIQTCAPYDL